MSLVDRLRYCELVQGNSTQKFARMSSQDSVPDDILDASYTYGSSPLTATDLTELRETFLFGYPIVHSMAPMSHATLFNCI
jgi:hypothetical protein